MLLDPTPRKLYKLTQFDFGTMQVISINDFERAQEAQLEYFMDGAVNQLESLAQPDDQRPTLADVTVQFGQLRLTTDDVPQPFRFDFEPPTTCKQWPGPRYGSFSLHNPLPSTKAKAKNKGSKPSRKHGQPEDLKPSLRPLKAPKPKKVKKVDVAPVLMSAKTSREPPLQLLELPPELRNAIWSLLAVHDDPIEAQLRPIRPCKRPKKLRGTIVRRFPREPIVASVNRQVRREVLSIFYGDNHFIFQKNGFSGNGGFRLTDPVIMRQWRSRAVSKHLSHLDLRFTTIARPFRTMSVAYKLHRLPDNRITIEVKAEKAIGKSVAAISQPCLCDEKDVISAMKTMDCGGDVVRMAMELTTKRNEKLFGEADILRGANRTFSPEQRTCEKCDKLKFETLWNS